MKVAGEKFDFEPDLLLQDVPLTSGSEAGSSLEKMRAALERAQRKAARWQQLQKRGIVSKVEAEATALRVVQLTAEVEAANAAAARGDVEKLRKEGAAEEVLAKAEAAAREAEGIAITAAEELTRAKTAAAILNLERQRKLRAAGLVSKAQLQRAEAAQRAMPAGK